MSARLLAAAILHRHGERTPLTKLPRDTSSWPEGKGPGLLTANGMKEAYNLGVRLRNRYVRSERILSPAYEAAELTVRSSDIDRCHQTAQSILLGLYGGTQESDSGHFLPGRMQPIPVHSSPSASDSLFRAHKTCPTYEAILKHRLESSGFLAGPREWEQGRTQKVLERLRFGTGVEIGTKRLLQELDVWADPIIVWDEVGRLNSSGLPAETLFVRDVHTLFNYVRSAMFTGVEVGRLTGGPLLAEIVGHLQRAAAAELTLKQQKEPLGRINYPKLLLLSGHDSNVQSLLSILQPTDLNLTSNPPFLASVAIELHALAVRDTTGAVEAEQTRDPLLTVRMLYNFKPFRVRTCKVGSVLHSLTPQLPEREIGDDSDVAKHHHREKPFKARWGEDGKKVRTAPCTLKHFVLGVADRMLSGPAWAAACGVGQASH